MKVEPIKDNPVVFGAYPFRGNLRNRPEDSEAANTGFKGHVPSECYANYKGCQPIKPLFKKFTTFTECELGISIKDMLPVPDPKPSILTKRIDYLA